MLDLVEREKGILEYWKAHEINRKVRDRNKVSGKPLYFLDGPPFVTGDLHLGQVWTKALKDLFLRYKRYRGFDVVDRAGYDTQGLPAENAVEKKLKLTSKKDIEDKIGIGNFVKECREYIDYYMSRWKNDYERFGVSLDFSDPYLPHSSEYIETEWSLFKSVHEKGYLYQGYRTTAYCPRCECVVSQGTMEVEHSDERDPSILITFKVDKAKSKAKAKLDGDVFLLVWTTTPWTLPANVAVAVNPEMLYVMARLRGKNMILAKERLDKVVSLLGESAVVLREFYGSELEGLRYTSLLEQKVPKQAELRKNHKVVVAPKLVSVDEGTGIVHIAPGHGLDDYTLGVSQRMPIFCPVGPDAAYTEEAGGYKGIRVPDHANAAVLADLKELGMLEYSGEVTHSYPHCWRCHSKVIFIATPQWFFNVQKVKKRLLKANDRIAWQPSDAQGWERELISNSPDWCISRQRYWATPMPIWICDRCGAWTVIGSKQELEASAANPDHVRSLSDLHRPGIDSVILRCGKCGGESRRVKDVIDVWFDSSTAFRSSLTKEQFERLFPVEFVIEYSEQIRAWFQYMIKAGIFIYGKSPVRNIVVHGILWGSDGKKMSKSLGNFTPLDELLKQASADAIRFWLLDHSQIDNRALNEAEIKDTDKLVLLVYNVANLLKEYADAAGYAPRLRSRIKAAEKEDAWLISRYASTLRRVTESLDMYDPYGATRAIKNFIVEDLSRFYLKLAKKRIAYGGKRQARAAIDLMNYVLYNTLVMISPITPFVAERVYLDRYGFKESIFLEKWPRPGKGMVDEQAEKDFAIAEEAITALLNSRDKAGAKLRRPLARGTVEVRDDESEGALTRLARVVEEIVNIKRLEVKRVRGFGKELVPIFTKIGPEFKADAQMVADTLRGEDAEKVEKEVAVHGHYSLHTANGLFDIKPEHFSVVEKLKNPDAAPFRHGMAYVDREVSDELLEEAMVREFERRVQLARKEAGLKKADKISLRYQVGPSLAAIVKRNAAEIKRYVNAKEMHDSIRDPTKAKEFEIEGEKIMLTIEGVLSQ